MQCKAISKVEKLILHLKQVNDQLLPPNSNDTALPIPLYFQKWLKFGEIIVELEAIWREILYFLGSEQSI